MREPPLDTIRASGRHPGEQAMKVPPNRIAGVLPFAAVLLAASIFTVPGAMAQDACAGIRKLVEDMGFAIEAGNRVHDAQENAAAVAAQQQASAVAELQQCLAASRGRTELCAAEQNAVDVRNILLKN